MYFLPRAKMEGGTACGDIIAHGSTNTVWLRNTSVHVKTSAPYLDIIATGVKYHNICYVGFLRESWNTGLRSGASAAAPSSDDALEVLADELLTDKRLTACCSNFRRTVASMSWLWFGAAKEKYSREDLYLKDKNETRMVQDWGLRVADL